ncbi:hypothetical protein TrLO_g14773 [Triparma laevis f. longispina]|uniref:TLC domain-containing protein n=1 Tax=Triparma laevis f. longispina TaxID=1714387 RepID=A0A9W6ZNT2_9STRA|nr:hypothetical protein TrLO_g14773 [Triparma laevis f. longispina]
MPVHHDLSPWQDFLYLGGEFVNSVVYGRRDSYVQSGSDLLPIPTGHDFFIFLYCMVTCFIINWGLRILVIEPFAKRVLPTVTKKKVEKYAQAALEMAFYTAFFFFGYRVYYPQTWVWPSSQWWDGFDKGDTYLIDPDYKFFYILYAGRYAAAFVSVLMEHKRSDFIEMQVHHMVTVILVLASYSSSYNRVGGAVMFLLDCADPPLHIAKQFKYCSVKKTDKAQFWADRWFEIFAVSFIVSRNIIYPYCCWSALIESKRYFEHRLDTRICNGLLQILLVLQFYWTSLIFIAVYKQMKNGGIEDIRSDSEDEEEEGTKKIARKKKGKKD